jgi:hypothetical protein
LQQFDLFRHEKRAFRDSHDRSLPRTSPTGRPGKSTRAGSRRMAFSRRFGLENPCPRSWFFRKMKGFFYEPGIGICPGGPRTACSPCQTRLITVGRARDPTTNHEACVGPMRSRTAPTAGRRHCPAPHRPSVQIIRTLCGDQSAAAETLRIPAQLTSTT